MVILFILDRRQHDNAVLAELRPGRVHKIVNTPELVALRLVALGFADGADPVHDEAQRLVNIQPIIIAHESHLSLLVSSHCGKLNVCKLSGIPG